MGLIEILELSKYFKVIELDVNVEKKYAIYHSQLGRLCVVDKYIYTILKSLSDNTKYNIPSFIDNEEITSVLEHFKNEGFLVRKGTNEYNYLNGLEKERMKNIATGSQINAVQLVVSNHCNYKCKYCFTNTIYSSKEREFFQKDKNNKLMNPEDAVNYLIEVLNVVSKNKKDNLHIQFFGGEPLTNWKAIKFVLDTFKNNYMGINIDYSIVTNGALINKEISDYFKKYNVPLIISFDSPNDSHRFNESGEKDINRIKEKLLILKNNENHVAFNSVLSADTFDYFNESIVDFAIEYNINEIGVLFDLDPSFYYNKSIEEISNKLLGIYRYASSKGIMLTGYWFSIFQNILTEQVYSKGFKTCAGTGSQLSIEPSGAVFSCKGSSGYYGLVNDLKSIFTNEKYKIYAKRSFRNSKDCNLCELEGFCSGYCLGALEKKFGNIEIMEKKVCSLNKLLIKKLVSLEVNKLDYYQIESKELVDVIK